MLLREYNKAGFVITMIHCDSEYKSLMDEVNDKLDIVMNYANAQDHVPEAERNNRVIKERIRAGYHHLPYKAIPLIMLRYLAFESTNKLNYFPVKGGVSQYYSPRTIMQQVPLEYGKHCTVPFGAYVQASNETNPTNTNAPRTCLLYTSPSPRDLSTSRMPSSA